MQPNLHDIEMAATRLAGRAVRTPMLSSPMLDEATGGRILLKCETLQKTGSFKFRGAYNAVAALTADARARGVVALSSGNHAQGVAAAAAFFGTEATIVMPADAPRAKVEGTKRFGGRVVPYDRAGEDRDEIAARIMATSGASLIHPFNDNDVIAGQGTVGLEIAEYCSASGDRPEAVLVPCSGGGLSAGIHIALHEKLPGARVHVVEPEGFDDYARSLAAGAIRPNERRSGSICDALMSRFPGGIGFEVNQRLGAGAVSVADPSVLAAVAFAFRHLKLVVEPGGAAGLAAVLSDAFDARGKCVVVVLSGGNIDPETMAAALASP